MISLILTIGLFIAQRFFANLAILKVTQLLMLFVMVSLSASYYAQSQLEQRLALRQTVVETKDVIVYVCKMSELKAEKRQQVIQVWDTSHQHTVNWLARLSSKQPELEIGHYYRLSGQVRPVHGYAIEGAFDQEKWFLQQNLMATVQVKNVQPLSQSEALVASSTKFVNAQQGLLLKFRNTIEKQRLAIRSGSCMHLYNIVVYCSPC